MAEYKQICYISAVEVECHSKIRMNYYCYTLSEESQNKYVKWEKPEQEQKTDGRVRLK